MLVYHHRLKSALIILSFSPQLCPCETPPGPTLHSCLGFVGQRCGPFGAGSGESHNNDLECLFCEDSLRGIVQSREEKMSRRLHCMFSVLKVSL